VAEALHHKSASLTLRDYYRQGRQDCLQELANTILIAFFRAFLDQRVLFRGFSYNNVGFLHQSDARRPFVIADVGAVVEDFSEYLQIVPGTFFRLGTCNTDKNTCIPQHNSRFNVDDDALQYGMKILSATALEYLSRRE